MIGRILVSFVALFGSASPLAAQYDFTMETTRRNKPCVPPQIIQQRAIEAGTSPRRPLMWSPDARHSP